MRKQVWIGAIYVLLALLLGYSAEQLVAGAITPGGGSSSGVIPTTLPPSGPAGGVLSGTYPNPGFASTTGSGATVLAVSPALTTPNIGSADATLINLANQTVPSSPRQFRGGASSLWYVPSNQVIDLLKKASVSTGLRVTRTSADVLNIQAICVVVTDTNNNGIPLYAVNVSPDKSVAGPAVNGRDQAGAFSNNTWTYDYVIYNGTTTASVVSSNATAPTLTGSLSTYTHYTRVHAANTTTVGYLTQSNTDGDVYYFNPNGDCNVVSAANSTADTNIDCSSRIPPISTVGTFLAYFTNTVTAGAQCNLNPVDANNIYVALYAPVAGIFTATVATMPAPGQAIRYKNSVANGSITVAVAGFKM